MNKRVKKSVSILPEFWEEAEVRAKRDYCSVSRVVEGALRVAFKGSMPAKQADRRNRQKQTSKEVVA